jgi:putative methyltransferase (TIGR04325 family)
MTGNPSWRGFVPPVALQWLRRATGRATVFRGPYPSWEIAAASATGYGTPDVLRRVSEAAQQVRDGLATYERDGVVLDQVEYSFPVLATLLLTAARNQRSLTVLDVGGSLGGTYLECRPCLREAVDRLQWLVVEQPSFVAHGNREMANDELRFFTTVDEAAQHSRPSVVLFSSVLQYLPEPWAMAAAAIACRPDYVAIDRTIVNDGATDRVYVQQVPSRIYRASYPVWSLSRRKLEACFGSAYDRMSAHPSLEFPALSTIGSTFEGFIYRRKDA